MKTLARKENTMNNNKRNTLVFALILTGVLIVGVFIWLIVNRLNEVEKMKSAYVEIGMTEKEVFRIWGEPNNVILARIGQRDSGYAIYEYDLKSGERLYLGFDLELLIVEIKMTDDSLICLADISSGVGTQIQIDFLTGKYEVTKPNYSFLFENSPISAEHVCQLEVGMKDSLILEVLGTPDKIIKNEPPIISVNYIYYLNDKYQLYITVLNDELSYMHLKDPKGKHVLTFLEGISPKGTRVTYDVKNGIFGNIYALSNLDVLSEYVFVQLNGLMKGMTEEQVIAKLELWEIIERRESSIGYSNLHFEESGGIIELRYAIGQNETLAIVFQDTLIEAKIYLEHDFINLIHYVDPIGTQIHYDSDTGYISKIIPE